MLFTVGAAQMITTDYVLSACHRRGDVGLRRGAAGVRRASATLE
jgi:hypothetical protein